jgi:hypothetical protein
MKKLRMGDEIYRSENEIREEVDQYSDFEHFRDMSRFWTHVDSNLPTRGIIKDSAKASAGYVRMGGM